MAAPGASGFSFLASMGSNYGAFSVVEIGGNVLAFMPGVGGGPSVNGFSHRERVGSHHFLPHRQQLNVG